MKRYELSLDKTELLFIIKLFDFFNNHHDIIEESDEEEIYRNVYFMMDSIQIEIEEEEKKNRINKKINQLKIDILAKEYEIEELLKIS